MGPARKRPFDCLPMKLTALSSCLAVFGLIIPVGAQTPDAHEQTDLTEERAAISAAAHAFSTELRREPTRGLPTPEQMQRLSPHLTPELASLLKRAAVVQAQQIRRHPDEKPDWIEGDLFSSLYEGVSTWKLGEVFSAPTVEATVQVIQTYSEPTAEPVTWTDTLVLIKRGQQWLLDDIRMGGDWEFQTGATLRGQLPGGSREEDDHTSLDERWQVKFLRDGDTTEGIMISSAEPSAQPFRLVGGADDPLTCPMPTWVVWSPEDNLIAVRLGESPRFTSTRLYRQVGKAWVRVPLPELYEKERKTLARHGFKERDRLIDAVCWQDANTLVLEYFGGYDKGDEGDGFHKFVAVRIDPKGRAKVIESVDVPGR